MVRDRIRELQQATQETIQMDDIASPLGQFITSINEVKNEITKLESRLTLIGKIQSDLCATITTTDAKRTQLDTQTSEFTMDMQHISEKLTNLGKEVRLDKSEHKALMEHHLRGQLDNLKKIVSKYQDLRSSYSKQQKDLFSRKCKIIDPAIDQQHIDDLLDAGMTNSDFQFGTKLKYAEADLADIRNRHASIFEIERSLRELHEMMVQLAIIVDSHTEIIDRIDTTVDLSLSRVTNATQKVSQARKYRESAMRKKLAIAVCLLVVLLILILVLLSIVGHYF